MHRVRAGALVPASVFWLVAAFAHSPAAAGEASAARVIPARNVCDANGRCYETGDPGYRDDDAPPPRRRYDPRDDDDAAPPPPRRRFDPDGDDDRPPPPPRRYDPDDDDRPPPPRHRYDPDGDN